VAKVADMAKTTGPKEIVAGGIDRWRGEPLDGLLRLWSRCWVLDFCQLLLCPLACHAKIIADICGPAEGNMANKPNSRASQHLFLLIVLIKKF